MSRNSNSRKERSLATIPSVSQKLNTFQNELDIPSNLKRSYELVMQYSSLGRYELATALCNQAIDEFSKVYGPEHIHVATLLNVLSSILRRQRQYNEATLALKNALVIREIHFNKDHPIVIKTINKLAHLYLKQNKLKEAEEFSKRGIEVRGHTLSTNTNSRDNIEVNSAKRASQLREKYFNIIVSKSSQIEKNRTMLTTSNKYLCSKIDFNN